MQNIDAKKIHVKDLLNRELFYRIPEYQRPYSWEKENFIDLIGDLTGASETHEYFLGTVVVHKRKDIYDVVDGQQRLTTILILLACLRDLIEEESFKKSIQEKIVQSENVVDGIPEKIRIEVKDREAFSRLIVPLNGTNQKRVDEYVPDPESRYLEAIDIFKNALKDYSQPQLQSFIRFLNQNCILVFLSTNTFDDAFRLFTIVNDRGKQLRRIDILKANNISPDVVSSERIRNSIAQKWETAEKELGDETFESVLFLLRLILVGEKPQKDLLVEFDERVFQRGIIQKGEPFVDLVCEYTKLYNDIFVDYSYFETTPLCNRLIGLIYIMNNEFKSNEWKATILLYIKKFGLEKFEDFLSLVELKYLEGWIAGQSKDTRAVLFANVIKLLNVSGRASEVIAARLFEVDSVAMKGGLEGHFYGKSYSKYILLRLELLSTEHDVEKKFKAKSIEHILPQNPQENSQWKVDFSDQQRNELTNTLANLVLLSKSKNSSAGNWEFDEKKRKYLANRVSDYPRSIEIMSIDRWTPDYLIQRQSVLIDAAFRSIF